MKQTTKHKQLRVISLIAMLLILFVTMDLNAQKITLRIGDLAPPINATKWLKGKPMPELEKGKVHVVEFGATW